LAANQTFKPTFFPRGMAPRPSSPSKWYRLGKISQRTDADWVIGRGDGAPLSATITFGSVRTE
jgi:hypothetical protein